MVSHERQENKSMELEDEKKKDELLRLSTELSEAQRQESLQREDLSVCISKLEYKVKERK